MTRSSWDRSPNKRFGQNKKKVLCASHTHMCNSWLLPYNTSGIKERVALLFDSIFCLHTSTSVVNPVIKGWLGWLVGTLDK